MRAEHNRLLFSIAVALAAPVSSAQLLPPPPPQTDLYPDWSPPAAGETREPVIDLDGQNRSTESAEDAEAERDEARRLREQDSIVEYDDQGLVIRIEGAVDMASLRATSTIQDALWPIIERELDNRARDMEQRVAARPDAALKLARGLIREIDLNDQASLMELVQATQPMNPEEPVIRHLAGLGAISEAQSDAAYALMYQYQNAVFQEFERTLSDSEEQYAVEKAKSVYLLEESMKEAISAFDRHNDVILEDANSYLGEVKLTKDQLERIGPWRVQLQNAQFRNDTEAAKQAWLLVLEQLEAQQLITMFEKSFAALEDRRGS